MVWSLGWDDPLRDPWQPTPVFLPGESPWTEKLGGLQSIGSQRVGHDWATKHSTAHEAHRKDYLVSFKNFEEWIFSLIWKCHFESVFFYATSFPYLPQSKPLCKILWQERMVQGLKLFLLSHLWSCLAQLISKENSLLF